jgi:hypothetical protein
MRILALTHSAMPGFDLAGPDYLLRPAAIDCENVTAHHAAGTV